MSLMMTTTTTTTPMTRARQRERERDISHSEKVNGCAQIYCTQIGSVSVTKSRVNDARATHLRTQHTNRKFINRKLETTLAAHGVSERECVCEPRWESSRERITLKSSGCWLLTVNHTHHLCLFTIFNFNAFCLCLPFSMHLIWLLTLLILYAPIELCVMFVFSKPFRPYKSVRKHRAEEENDAGDNKKKKDIHSRSLFSPLHCAGNRSLCVYVCV